MPPSTAARRRDAHARPSTISSPNTNDHATSTPVGAGVSSHPKLPIICEKNENPSPIEWRTTMLVESWVAAPGFARFKPPAAAIHATCATTAAAIAAPQIRAARLRTRFRTPARPATSATTTATTATHSGPSWRHSARTTAASPTRRTSLASISSPDWTASTVPDAHSEIAAAISTPLGLTTAPRNNAIGVIANA